MKKPLLTSLDNQHLRHKWGVITSRMRVSSLTLMNAETSWVRNGSFMPTPPTPSFSHEGIDTSFYNCESMATVILLDSGYFVGRMQKHWSPKGKMRKAHQSIQAERKSIGFNGNISIQKCSKLRYGLSLKSSCPECELIPNTINPVP